MGLPWWFNGWDSAFPLQGAQVQPLVGEIVSCGKQNKTKTVDFGILQTHLFLQRKYKTECSKGLQLRKKKNSSWARIPEAKHRPRSLRPHGKQHLPPFRKKTNCTADPSTAPQMSLLPSGEAESYSHKINNCLQIFPLALMV